MGHPNSIDRKRAGHPPLNGNNSQGFSYDNLNRIAAFANGGGNMQQTYSIDPWGNLSQSGTLSSGLFFTDAATNRDTSGTLGYDNAGNVTGWASDYQGTLNHSYAYDPEGHITGVDNGAATYTYEAEGNRARKDSGGSWTEYVYFNGQPLAENNGGAIWIDYIFANGVRLAQGSSINAPNDSSATIYYHSDQLSSTRLLTDSGGNVVSSYEFYPFGQGPQPSGQNHYLYTGKERDSESGNDYFGARYYASSMGRMLSPDPVFISADRIADPQGLNLYAYARNNPLTITDPTGLDFYQTCTHTKDNGSTCQQVQNGSSKVWVQGTTGDNGTFTANRIANDANGNLVDVNHGNAAATGAFDQNGVHINGAQGVFMENSNETTLQGSSIFTGVQGNFFDACGGSCQAHGALSDADPGSGALGHALGFLNQQSWLSSQLDALSGAHPSGTTQWKDSNGYVHLIQVPGNMMDMHFEGHPTGVDVTQFVLHMVDTIRDKVSGRAATESQRNQNEESLP